MEAPEEFEGSVSIIWPRPRDGMLRAWGISILRDGKPITTVTRLAIEADTRGIVWAALTMLTGEDGHPVYDGAPSLDDEGNIRLGTFAFLVVSMSLDAPPAPVAAMAIDGYEHPVSTP